MIIKSIKGDGVEHLVKPVSTDLWGWENLHSYLVPSGVDEDTGEQVYREAGREVFGKTIEIGLHNDGDNPETIAVTLWFALCTVGTTPKEILPGKSEFWSIILDERRRVIWCLMRLTQ